LSENLILGIDVGGTKIAAGLVDSRGQIVARLRRPMVARRSAEEGLAAVVRAAQAVLAGETARSAKIEAAGISAPGVVDPYRGVVVSATNLPCWRDFPLAARVSEALRLPVRLDNDGNAAALAEALWGAGVGFRSVFYVTLGTGIGTGLVLDGRVRHGRTGAAGEGGHMTINFRGPRCACGKRGCIEQYAAGPAIALRAQEKLSAARSRRGHAKSKPAKSRTPKSKMLTLAGSAQAVTAEIVGKAALDGDAMATEVLHETAESLAIWLGGIMDLLEPEVIVIGGGLGHLMANFGGHIRTQLERWSINPRSREIPIVGAMYGAVSGIAGAAALCMETKT